MRSVVMAGGLATAVILVGTAMGGAAQDRGSPTYDVSGSYTYRTYCASCHGLEGKGDGPLAENLRFFPPDLSQLARRNGGEYPAEDVARVVDGRNPIDGHGGPDMPVWGDAFKNPETGFDDEKVHLKILSVVDYLKTLQED
jgi:mono/diheme cytochrome c family protein